MAEEVLRMVWCEWTGQLSPEMLSHQIAWALWVANGW